MHILVKVQKSFILLQDYSTLKYNLRSINIVWIMHRECNELAPMMQLIQLYPDSKVQGANMGPTWVLSARDGPHVGPMTFAIWVCCGYFRRSSIKSNN